METKKWYLSKGVWGNVLSFAMVGLGLLGYSITPELKEAVQATVDNAVVVGTGIATLMTNALGLWGRIKATKKLV